MQYGNRKNVGVTVLNTEKNKVESWNELMKLRFYIALILRLMFYKILNNKRFWFMFREFPDAEDYPAEIFCFWWMSCMLSGKIYSDFYKKWNTFSDLMQRQCQHLISFRAHKEVFKLLMYSRNTISILLTSKRISSTVKRRLLQTIVTCLWPGMSVRKAKNSLCWATAPDSRKKPLLIWEKSSERLVNCAKNSIRKILLYQTAKFPWPFRRRHFCCSEPKKSAKKTAEKTEKK